MTWINFLHLYQPINTDAHIIKEATEMSYKRIVKALEENPKIKFTLNISGCLLLRLEELGYHELIKKIDTLLKNGQIELVGSAAYHPILPLIPSEEARRQIKENEDILKKYFNIKPKGFFMPEMAYSPEAGVIIKEFGYEWIILDEIALTGELNKADFNKNYQEENGLTVVLRKRNISKKYVPDELKKKISGSKLYITATDGELYGLRHIDPTGEFEKILKLPGLETMTISEFIKTRTENEKVKLKKCNWESTEDELKNNIPYALWFNKKNKIQQNLWQLANLAYNVIENNKEDVNYYWARWHMVRGFASCAFWWASGKNLGPLSPIPWNPDEIERGTNELIRSIRALHNEETKKEKIKAEKLYIKIKQMVWQKHWAYYWKNKKI